MAEDLAVLTSGGRRLAKGRLGSALVAVALVIAAAALLLVPANQDLVEYLIEKDPCESAALAFEWSHGPSMLQPRAHPAVVVLGDGKIAAIGGITAVGPTSTTEVLDPETWSWRPGPSMLSKRVGHTAHLLADGRVCVIGGDTGAGATASVELLDLSAGFSTWLPDMFFARAGHSSVVLPDGRILVTGGTDWVTGVWREAEVYDPSSRIWSPAGSMSRARLFSCAERISGTEVLLIGGDTDGTSEIFDASTASWGSVASMSSKRSRASSAALADGSVMVVGGLLGDQPLRSSEMFDPASRSWVSTAEMGQPRAGFSLVMLPSNELLASGSYSKLGTDATCEVFSPRNSTWYGVDPMDVGRGAHGCALGPGGSVLIFGGYSGDSLTSTMEIFAEMPPEAPEYCQPIDLLPLVLSADELPGHSQRGLIVKLHAAQAKYNISDFQTCINIMNAFHNQVCAFAQSDHMTVEHALALYEAYASVVKCLGGTPLPPPPDMTP
ncbi:MAG: hypothetical protein JW880_03715 [Candidatus Thermoplasmatota archaeon]|nr:hypothetical protein [Candidatus Thermoplasmatota archaeon]